MVDDPYVLNGGVNAKDYYPLVKPVPGGGVIPEFSSIMVVPVILLLMFVSMKVKKMKNRKNDRAMGHKKDTEEVKINY
jgi:formiminotetrahydrofolate cyclodeaminase